MKRKKKKLLKGRSEEELLFHGVQVIRIEKEDDLLRLHKGNYFEAFVNGYRLAIGTKDSKGTHIVYSLPMTLEDLQELRRVLRKAIRDIKAETKKKLWNA